MDIVSVKISESSQYYGKIVELEISRMNRFGNEISKDSGNRMLTLIVVLVGQQMLLY